MGYKVWETEVENRHWGDITIVWIGEEGWQVKGAKIFGTNVVIFTVILGRKRWYVVRAYVPPNNQLEIHRVAHTLECRPDVVGALLVGNLNAYLVQPRDQREEDLAIII